MFSIVTTYFTFITTVNKGFNFSTSFLTLNFCDFDNGHPNRCELIFDCAFDLYFPDD